MLEHSFEMKRTLVSRGNQVDDLEGWEIYPRENLRVSISKNLRVPRKCITKSNSPIRIQASCRKVNLHTNLESEYKPKYYLNPRLTPQVLRIDKLENQKRLLCKCGERLSSYSQKCNSPYCTLSSPSPKKRTQQMFFNSTASPSPNLLLTEPKLLSGKKLETPELYNRLQKMLTQKKLPPIRMVVKRPFPTKKLR